jgi:hypothetical protein
MAYNPVVRGGGGVGAAGAGANTNTNNLNLGGGATGQGNNDQFSVQNMQPEDYLGKPKSYF